MKLIQKNVPYTRKRFFLFLFCFPSFMSPYGSRSRIVMSNAIQENNNDNNKFLDFKKKQILNLVHFTDLRFQF